MSAVSEKKDIYTAMAAVMRGVGGISKSRKNQQQNYQFRGIDDVYDALHGLMAEAGIVMAPEVVEHRQEERQSKGGSTLIYTIVRVRYHFIAGDGSSVGCITMGEGMDSGDKSTNKAMSAAQKYALLQTFLIPTTEKKDSEEDSHEVAPKAQPAPVKQSDTSIPSANDEPDMLTAIREELLKCESEKHVDNWINKYAGDYELSLKPEIFKLGRERKAAIGLARKMEGQ